MERIRGFLNHRRWLPAGLIVLVLLTMAGCGVVADGGDSGPLEASGVIRAQQVDVASEYGGRIAEVLVTDGDVVVAGQPLVQLDTAMVDAQIEVAEAALEMAQAGLDQGRAGARSGQIAVAEAQLAQAEAGVAAARQAVTDTRVLVDNPQDIDLQIAVADAQLEVARHRAAEAVAMKDAAEVAKDAFEEAYDRYDGGGETLILISSGSIPDLEDDLPPEFPDDLPELSDGVYQLGDFELHIEGDSYELYKWEVITFPLEAHLLPNAWWQAWVGVNAAQAQEEGAEATLGHLYGRREAPQTLQVQADEAESSLAQAEAQREMAQAQLDGLRAGATEEQIGTLEARVEQARSALQALEKQREQLRVTSPISGTVLDVVMFAGEVAAQGATVVTVADLSEVTVEVYVRENEIGRVTPGQAVSVRVDSYPERVFHGRVRSIADEAEFTPRNVATKEERVKLVFAVTIQIPNEDGALKPGMPADAVFKEEEG